MAKYVIEGGCELKGEVEISGNKNSILPCLAAALLTEDEVFIKNVPDIADVRIFTEILKVLGSIVEYGDHFIKISTPEIISTKLPKDLVTKLRASILLVGPLLSRAGKANFSHPGGDIIGKRSIQTHISGFESLGFEFKVEDRDYEGSKVKNSNSLCEIFLDEPSVTATENLVLASVLGEGEVIIRNCAEEPHVVDLCMLLSGMGAKISGIGTSTLKIEKVNKLHGSEFTISPEHIEIGTYAVAAAITKGKIVLKNCFLKNLEPLSMPLEKMGVQIRQKDENSLVVSSSGLKSIHRLTVAPWPGFPTDLMSVFIVLATQSHGVSLLHDWMYESRMFFVDKLISMGASITIADPHRVLVYGPTKLWAREMETPDIRAGMALVLAALVAKGTSVINKAELIERGYEDVIGNLNRLGASVSRIE